MSKKPNVPIAFEDRLCLLLDILGFKALIADTVKGSDMSSHGPHRVMTVQRVHSALLSAIILTHLVTHFYE